MSQQSQLSQQSQMSQLGRFVTTSHNIVTTVTAFSQWSRTCLVHMVQDTRARDISKTNTYKKELKQMHAPEWARSSAHRGGGIQKSKTVCF